MVSVKGSNASLHSTASSFINSSCGALSVYDGGEFRGEAVAFMNNNPGLEQFPSMRYNIICMSSLRLDSLVNITSVGGGSDGEDKNTSMWINAVENCTLDGILSTYTSAFYIPSVSGIELATTDNNYTASSDGGGVVTVSGASFVPCELSCTVTADTHMIGIDLTAINETVAIGRVNESSFVILEAARDISVKMNGEKGEGLTESFVVELKKSGTSSKSVKKEDEESTNNFTSLTVTLLVVSLLFIVVLMVVIITLAYLYFTLKKQYGSLAEKMKQLDVEMNEEKEGKEETKDGISIDEVTSEFNSSLPVTTGNEYVMSQIVPQEEGEGKGENVYPIPTSIPVSQSEVQELFDIGNGGGEEEEHTVEDQGKKTKKKKSKKKKTKTLNETGENDEEGEGERLDYTTESQLHQDQNIIEEEHIKD